MEALIALLEDCLLDSFDW